MTGYNRIPFEFELPRSAIDRLVVKNDTSKSRWPAPVNRDVRHRQSGRLSSGLKGPILSAPGEPRVQRNKWSVGPEVDIHFRLGIHPGHCGRKTKIRTSMQGLLLVFGFFWIIFRDKFWCPRRPAFAHSIRNDATRESFSGRIDGTYPPNKMIGKFWEKSE